MKIPFTKLDIGFKPSFFQKHLTYPLSGMGAGSVSIYNAKYPLKEKAIRSIAKHFSVVVVGHFNVNEYKNINDDLTYILKVRPNKFQTPTEFFELFFYNLITYGNAIMIPTYTKNGTLEELNILDMTINSIGWINPKNKKASEKYLFIYNANTQEYKAVEYSNIIHQRLDAQQIQNGEQIFLYENSIPEIIDENLTSILTELKNNFNIKGVFTLGSSAGLNKTMLSEEAKLKKVDDVIKRVKNKTIVLDAGEKWEEKDGKFLKTSIEDMNILEDKLYEMYGIPSSIAHNNYTFEEYSAFHRSFIEPQLKSLEEEFSYKLLSKNKLSRGERITFRIPLISAVSFKDMINFMDKGKYHGAFSVNDIRTKLGEVPVEGGDVYTGNLNMANPDGTKVNSTLKGGDENE